MKELFMQIVDDNDDLIGDIERSRIDYEKNIYRVAALWLTNSKGEFLIAQRKLTKDRDPGMWGPAVAGTVEAGETYTSNIYKEAEEEIGLTGLEFYTGPKLRVHVPRNYFCQWFTATLDRAPEEFVLQEDEVEAVTWIGGDKLLYEVQNQPEKYIPGMYAALEVLGIV